MGLLQLVGYVYFKICICRQLYGCCVICSPHPCYDLL